MVSIIVPVYNAQATLTNCLNHILKQTYRFIEVILVNDGSTDHSRELCDACAKKNTKVKAIHQENAGPSAARNTGIQAATGDYIQFVDADDYIEPTMTEKLVKAMERNVQLVICGYTSVYNNVTIKRYLPSIEGIYDRTSFINHIGELYKNIILPSPCNKLYVTKQIRQFEIRFIENLHIGEDLLFNLAYIQTCERIHMIPDPLYNYVITSNLSLSRGFNKDLTAHQQMLHRKVEAFLEKNHCYNGANAYFLNIMYTNSIVNRLQNLFHQHSTLPSKQQKRQILKIISDDKLQKHTAYFQDNMQTRLIGKMIKHKSVQGIYWFFKGKNILRHRMSPLFHRLKSIHNK